MNADEVNKWKEINYFFDDEDDKEYFSCSDDDEMSVDVSFSDSDNDVELQVFTDNDDDENGSEGEPDENGDEHIEIIFRDTLSKALVLWAVKFFISHTALTALLLILRAFGHKELPKLASTLLRTPRKAVKPRVCLPGEFFYRGIEFNLLQYNYEFLKECDEVHLDFFIDGLSVSDSSKVKMWPIMGSLVGYPKIRPFVIGCYSGKGDPADVDDYMREFVDELKELNSNGVAVTKDKINKKFSFRCFVGDGPAMALANGTMGHASYFGCPKCDQVCCADGHKMYYQFFIGKLRTDESFREREDILHHKPQFQKKASLLESVIGMVSQFAIDCMHAVDIGVTKKIMKFVLKEESKIFATLNARFQSFRAYVPSDFERKPRTLGEFDSFKANECRQMLLYTIPVLLKGLISENLYGQMIKLHVAIRLLSDPLRYKDNLSAARKLISEFVFDYDESFGKNNFTFNTHILLHLPDYAERYGPIYSFSAYKYENHMRLIRRLLRRKNGHIQQFFNRCEEMRYAAELEENDGVWTESRCNEFILEPNNLRDGCCMLDTGYPVIITEYFTREGRKMMRGRRFLQCDDFYVDPVPSMENMGIILASNLNPLQEEFPVNSIVYKFFRLPFEDKDIMDRLILNKWIVPKPTSQPDSEIPVPFSTNNEKTEPITLTMAPSVIRGSEATFRVKGGPSTINHTKRETLKDAFQTAAREKRLDNFNFAIPLPLSSYGQSKRTILPLIENQPVQNVRNVDLRPRLVSQAIPKVVTNRDDTRKIILQSRERPLLLSPYPPKKTQSTAAAAAAESVPASIKSQPVQNVQNWKLNLKSRMVNVMTSTSVDASGDSPIEKKQGKHVRMTVDLKSLVPLPSTFRVGPIHDHTERTTGDVVSCQNSFSRANSSIKSVNRGVDVSSTCNYPYKFAGFQTPDKLEEVTVSTEEPRSLQVFHKANVYHGNAGSCSQKSYQRIVPLPKNFKLIKALPKTSAAVKLDTKNQPDDFINSSSTIRKTSEFSEFEELDSSSQELSKIYRSDRSSVVPSLEFEANSHYSSLQSSAETTIEGSSFVEGSENKQSCAKKMKRDDENDDFIAELREIKKSGLENSINIKKILKMLSEEDPWTTFELPLKTFPELEKFERHLLRKRFTKKLVLANELVFLVKQSATDAGPVFPVEPTTTKESELFSMTSIWPVPISMLQFKISRSTDVVSDLVEIIFDEDLLVLFNPCGYGSKKSFLKLRINEIFLGLSGMVPELYKYNLQRVMNKMHMRYSRRQENH